MRVQILISVLVGTLSGVLFVPSPATAALESEPIPSQDSSCILNLESGEYRCFETIDMMVTELSDGDVTDVNTAAELMEPQTVQAVDAAAATTTVTAIFWAGSNYSGAGLVMEAPHGCDADLGVDWSWATLRSDWDDRFNSGIGYSKCQIKVFEETYFGGASLGYFGQDTDFGAMNNETESVRMR